MIVVTMVPLIWKLWDYRATAPQLRLASGMVQLGLKKL
jgi:hypothetical protein